MAYQRLCARRLRDPHVSGWPILTLSCKLTNSTPLMLDQYEAEWNEKCRLQTVHIRQLEAHARETEQLRGANRHLSSQM